MCSRKCFRLPTLIILGVILTIVLVFITGITLTNSINISNIIKLREKVASDSAAQSGATAAQTRAALVEQQYATLQQHHLSRSDLNYIAATHPKNLQRFAGNTNTPSSISSAAAKSSNNKIVIEIGIRNLNDMATTNSNVTTAANISSTARLASSETLSLNAPITSAIIDGNIDSISVPAVELPQIRQLNESLARMLKSAARKSITTTKTTFAAITTTAASIETTTNRSAFEAEVNPTTTSESAVETTMSPSAAIDFSYSILDRNPAMIDFEKRNHVKKVIFSGFTWKLIH